MSAEPALSLSVPDALIEAIAQRTAAVLEERRQATDAPEPFIGVDEAAAFLGCDPKRIYDLRRAGRIRVAKDGARLLFRISWLEEYVRAGEGAP